MSAELMAARRDASLYKHPGRSRRMHVVVDGGMACDGARQFSGRGLVAEFTREPAAGVPRNLRCQRPGCRARWP